MFDILGSTRDMAKQLPLRVDGWTVVLEFPEHYSGGGSAKAQGAANSGSTLKLAAMVGALMMQWSEAGANVELVTPSTWKGQVPKSVTAMRVKRHWNWVSASEDETDAVGLFDWCVRKNLSYEAVKVDG